MMYDVKNAKEYIKFSLEGNRVVVFRCLKKCQRDPEVNLQLTQQIT